MQEEEVDRRVAAEKRVADVQRVLQTEQDERKRAEDRARDSRALVRTLEQQLSRREPSQVRLCPQTPCLCHPMPRSCGFGSRLYSPGLVLWCRSGGSTRTLHSMHPMYGVTVIMPAPADLGEYQVAEIRMRSRLHHCGSSRTCHQYQCLPGG